MKTREGGPLRTNFAHLQSHDEQLVRLGMLAERYSPDDPNTSRLKLSQLAELLAHVVAAKVGINASREEAQCELLRRLQDQGILPPCGELKRLDVSARERSDYGLAVGDVVIDRVNSLPYVGKAALIRGLPEECVFESNTMRIRLDTGRVRRDDAILVLTSPDGDRLAPSLLAKASRGELVPQDPSDEPAPRLLARLRARTDSAASADKPKRAGTRHARKKATAETTRSLQKDRLVKIDSGPVGRLSER